MTRLADRLARLERMQPAAAQERRFLVMPWDPIPEHTDSDLVCLYRITDQSGDRPVEYDRNGIHPHDDVTGSRNRQLYFGGNG